MGCEAVTTTGWTSKKTESLPSQPVSRARTGPESPPRPLPCAAPSSAPAGSATPSPPRSEQPGATSKARSAAAPTRRPTSSCSASPTSEIHAAADALTPSHAQFVGHCSGATTLEPLAGREAFSLHPLMTVPADDGSAARSAAPAAPSPARTERALTVAQASPRPSTCAPSTSPTRTAPPTTPPRRSPPTSSSRSRAPRSGSPPPPASPRELLVPLARAALENWAATGRRAGPHRPRRARRRGHDRAPARGDRGARARPARRRSMRSSPHRGWWWRHEDDPHRRGDAGAQSRRSRRRAQDRPRPDDGRVPRRPRVADARRPQGQRRDGRLAIRQPGAVRRSARPRRLPPRRGARRGRRRGPRRRRPLRAAHRAGLPRRVLDDRRRRRPLRHPRGRPPRRGPLRRRLHRRGQAVQHGRARRGLLRPEGRAAGRRPQAHGARSRLPAADRGPPHRPRPGRPRDVEPQPPPEPRGASPRGRALEALAAATQAIADDSADPLAAARAALAAYDVVPEYLALGRPRHLPGTRPTESSWPSPPVSATPV